MNGIVVGVDESHHAQSALRWAIDHGARTNQPVTAVMAWGYLDQHYSDPGKSFDAAYGAETARKALEAIVTRAAGPNHAVRLSAVCDRPAPALLEAARDASLLVVGARGLGGFRGLLVGSVSRHVLHKSTCPVAVIRADHGHEAGPIVAGVDGSEPSRRALDWAIDVARATQRPLLAIHAWRVPYRDLDFAGAYLDSEELARDAVALLDEQLAALDESGLVGPIERRVVNGGASEALLDAADGASMVVVGSRGHGRFTDILLGSVSAQVSQHATCPVVVVP
jgi:nucleotide-binding universal stress UspA family protein